MDEYSYWEAAQDALTWPENRSFQQLAGEVAEAGKQRSLGEHEFRSAVRNLYDTYFDFLAATNPWKVEPEYRTHWYNHFRTARLDKKHGEPPLSRDLLGEAAFKYLKGPLRVPMVDRGLIDGLIAQETFAFIDAHAGFGALLTKLGCLGGFLVATVVLGFLFGEPERDWNRFYLVMGGLAALMLIVWAWPRRGPFKLYLQMRDTYQLLTGSVVSVPELRRRVALARDKGVVWPPELYAMLDDVEARTKVL